MNLIFSITFVYLIWFVGAIKIDCDKADSINEDHIHYCCKHPDDHNVFLAQCALETGFKLPNPNEQSIVDLTAARAIAATCFANCIFNKFNMMKDKNLDMEVVRSHFTTKFSNDTEYATEMINAFDHCHGKTEENTTKFLSNPVFRQLSQNFCDPKPSVILACVIREFFHNCPSDRWSKTQECQKALQFSKSCSDALATL